MFYQKAINISDELIKIRRDLHQIPELENNEYKTSSYIKKVLDELNIPYTSVIDTGILAEIKGKKGDGKTVIIRADIDALPIEEKTSVEYISNHKGIMHACGHDVHISCALGVCMLLKEIDFDFCGTLKIMFQPAEEGDGGAERMINSGVMQNPNVDFGVALHVEPSVNVGTILYRNGTIMASPDNFIVKIKGIGGHGACPDMCNNPIYCASELAVKLKEIVADNFDNVDDCVVSVCTFNAGTQSNIIPEYVEITGTARSLTEDTRDKIENLINTYTVDVCKKYNCEFDYEFIRLYPPVVNSSQINKILLESIKTDTLNIQALEQSKSSMTGDDFSYISKLVPSTYFKLGAGNDSINAPLHSPYFDIDESSLSIGCGILTTFVLNILK